MNSKQKQRLTSMSGSEVHQIDLNGPGQLRLSFHTPCLPTGPGSPFQSRSGMTCCRCACLQLCFLDRPLRPTPQLTCLQSLSPGCTPWMDFSDPHFVAPCSWWEVLVGPSLDSMLTKSIGGCWWAPLLAALKPCRTVLIGGTQLPMGLLLCLAQSWGSRQPWLCPGSQLRSLSWTQWGLAHSSAGPCPHGFP